jgi:hypothetical protein
MNGVGGPQPLRHQQVDVLANEGLRRVFEHLLRLQIGEQNAPLPIDDDHRIR